MGSDNIKLNKDVQDVKKDVKDIKKDVTSIRKFLYLPIFEAVFVAMFVILSIYGTINVGGKNKITAQNLPLIIGAIVFGPAAGALIGFAGMFINQMLTYGFTPTTLIWVLPHTIIGGVIGFIFENKNVRNDRGIKFWVSIIFSMVALTILNTFAILADSLVFGYYNFMTVFVPLIVRLMISVLTSIVYCCVIPPILKVIYKIVL